MNTQERRPIEFPPINRHGVIGDRRTGALVAADGTLNWFCVPDFDGTPIFASLLDPEVGGFCRFGPKAARFGRQHYLSETAAVVTTWANRSTDCSLELTDLMAWPANKRSASIQDSRVIIRRLQVRGVEEICFEVRPQWGFLRPPEEILMRLNEVIFSFEDGQLTVWSSFPLRVEDDAARADLRVLDDELWVAIAWNSGVEAWTLSQITDVFDQALKYWRDWNASLDIDAPEALHFGLHRSATTVHLLTHAEHECPVAALTTSLPERFGGDRNYDYRFAWVRDASLSLALLARLGKVQEVQHYLDWLCRLDSGTDSPLQVCYRLNGDVRLDEIELSAVRGYADSRPVRFGNRAAKQRQVGSLAFFADCARIYVENGGAWEDKHWRLLKRVANYACETWHLPESGIWELPKEAHYVASKVLSWVILERASRIATLTGLHSDEDVVRWNAVAQDIHSEVMKRGWSTNANSFVQRYDSDVLDAAVLLIPLMEFLPAEHPRVTDTLAAVERELVVDGLVHRFDPNGTFGSSQLAIGEYEGAFLPATFWYAHALAKQGSIDQAEIVLRRCESIAGQLGLFAEEADPRKQIFIGNTPLLFAQVEYARAVREVANARHRARDPQKEAYAKS
jgi:alpha,alpha-trehalase